MARRKLDMLNIMSIAMSTRKITSGEKRIEQFKILLSRAYNIMRGWYDYNCLKEKIENKNLIFKVFEIIIVKIAFCDNKINQEEYELYCAFAKYCKFEPKTIKGCKDLYRKTTVDYLKQCILYVLKFRDIIPPDMWEQMILGFCFLPFANDIIYEIEYYIISAFFEDDFDTKPKTWEEFKNVWKSKFPTIIIY